LRTPKPQAAIEQLDEKPRVVASTMIAKERSSATNTNSDSIPEVEEGGIPASCGYLEVEISNPKGGREAAYESSSLRLRPREKSIPWGLQRRR